MSAALYAPMALAAAQDIVSRGRAVLVVGGSGFYLRSFFAPVADGVEVAADVRARVAGLLESGGIQALVAELGRLNPGGVAGIDLANPRRVAAALGRCLASGRTQAELSADFARARPAFAGWDVRLERLDRAGPDLEARIRARAEAMLRAGLVDEVRRLLGAGLLGNPSAARAIGYRETADALAGRAPMEGLASAIAKDTRALVKKQRTWFRTQLPAHAVHDKRPTRAGAAPPLPRVSAGPAALVDVPVVDQGVPDQVDDAAVGRRHAEKAVMAADPVGVLGVVDRALCADLVEAHAPPRGVDLPDDPVAGLGTRRVDPGQGRLLGLDLVGRPSGASPPPSCSRSRP